jgi:hypothetical protein
MSERPVVLHPGKPRHENHGFCYGSADQRFFANRQFASMQNSASTKFFKIRIGLDVARLELVSRHDAIQPFVGDGTICHFIFDGSDSAWTAKHVHFDPVVFFRRGDVFGSSVSTGLSPPPNPLWFRRR